MWIDGWWLPREVDRKENPLTTEQMIDIDTEKVDRAVLAVLYLTLHEGARAWKGVDWDALARLHEKDLILDPVGKAKSVVFTDEGLRMAEECYRTLFART